MTNEKRKPAGALGVKNIADNFDAPDAAIVALFEGEAEFPKGLSTQDGETLSTTAAAPPKDGEAIR
ncbi:hypothetical protein [Azospirillum sp. TSO22-1]|uniref:hypothetical protein n=1 Tax=Azospirillum sp. TSO22-1 TaxID=716789 RepID=UPI000D617B6D|nr:hypothetical protein [Azospirillum sp. TSO22-1]PWC56059.1 hypothetical protein TSO221_03180 [Azospirillum sp. TSO22-1]